MEEYGTVRKSGRTHVSPRFSSLLLLSSRQSGATCQSGEGRERSSECFVALAREREPGEGGSGSLSIKREAARRWAVGCHSRRHFPPPLSALLPHHLSLSLPPPATLNGSSLLTPSLFVVALPSTHTRPPRSTKKTRTQERGGVGEEALPLLSSHGLSIILFSLHVCLLQTG